jgi:hypothetical protein
MYVEQIHEKKAEAKISCRCPFTVAQMVMISYRGSIVLGRPKYFFTSGANWVNVSSITLNLIQINFVKYTPCSYKLYKQCDG